MASLFEYSVILYCTGKIKVTSLNVQPNCASAGEHFRANIVIFIIKCYTSLKLRMLFFFFFLPAFSISDSMVIKKVTDKKILMGQQTALLINSFERFLTKRVCGFKFLIESILFGFYVDSFL